MVASLLNDKTRLFLLSFLILFLELALIRWIPANMRLVSYFSNLILLGTFFGLGIGLLLSKKSFALINFFPFILLTLLVLVVIFRIEVNVTSPDVLFFQGLRDNRFRLEPEFLLPVVFLFVAAVFIPLAQELGRVFSKLPPLKAYSWDIAGALAGIILFSFSSFLSLPAYLWFGLVAAVTFLFIPKKKSLLHFASYLALIGSVILPLTANLGSIWSPYYKLTLINTVDDFGRPGYVLNANNISHQYIHQYIEDYNKREPFYYLPYDAFTDNNYKRVLIIGAGTGSDTAIALGENPQVERIDAVEIDPKILHIGKLVHPNRPYDDPRVNIVIDDGRSFLQNSSDKYDLIIYALTDSVTITSGSANIRLESFLFTKESFQLAKDHLSENGLLVLYNYYRRDWLINKIAATLKEVFGEKPYVLIVGDLGRSAILMAGPKTAQLINHSYMRPYLASYSQPIAEDNWPFLYLKDKGIPFFYSKFLIIIFLLSMAIFWLVIRKQTGPRLDWRFFFLGAGFLLLETKNLVTFGLLFGTTWLTNSLVFSAILLSVLMANLVSMRWTIKHIWFLYMLLFMVLVINFLIPASIFINLPLQMRFIFASIFYFSPIFFANLIFSQTFKNTTQSVVSFGSNMLGAMLGGLLEYSALALGYQALFIFVALFYLLSIIKVPKILWSKN